MISNRELLAAVDLRADIFQQYLDNLQQTGGAPYQEMLGILNSLHGADLQNFIEGLGKYSTIEELQPNYLQELGASTFSDRLFNLQPRGIGPGELWLAWLVHGVRVSGAGETFDITHNQTQRYEVKSYTDSHSPFRLGNAGAASRFAWLRKMRQAAEIVEHIIQLPELKELHARLYAAAEGVDSRGESSAVVDFSRGEISKRLMGSMLNFIRVAHSELANRNTNYDIIQVKSTSPGNPNLSFIIEPITESGIERGEFKIIKSVNMAQINTEEALYRMLAKNEYIRDGIEALVRDINTGIVEVERKYSGTQFVVFRKKSMTITSSLQKIQGADILSQYGAGKRAVVGMSGALLRVREKA